MFTHAKENLLMCNNHAMELTSLITYVRTEYTDVVIKCNTRSLLYTRSLAVYLHINYHVYIMCKDYELADGVVCIRLCVSVSDYKRVLYLWL